LKVFSGSSEGPFLKLETEDYDLGFADEGIFGPALASARIPFADGQMLAIDVIDPETTRGLLSSNLTHFYLDGAVAATCSSIQVAGPRPAVTGGN
jgi:hypothetical protein